MQNSSRSSVYNEITLEKEGVKPVALEGRTVQFSYYESLLSPHITANLRYVDTGNGLKANGTDTQERHGTILRSLPIEGTGNENVKFKITSVPPSGERDKAVLDFTKYPLVISQAIPLGQESTREFVELKMVSKYAIVNENTNVYQKHYNNITNSISSILTKILEIPSDKLFLDQTKNSYAFLGSGRRCFDVVSSCLSKSIPLEGSPGFLFWETKDGFNFKAIDNIISSKPVATYRYYGVRETNLGNKDNFRILTNPTYQQNKDVIKALRSGVYKTKNIGWNPYTFEYQELFLTLDKSGIKTLGSKPTYDSKFTDQNISKFTRTFNFIIDTGNMEVGISTAINNNPLEYLAKAAMRYNIFMSQIMDIVVPINPKLKAGDVIQCEFEKVTPSNKNEGSVDEHQSGKYVILNLCHSFSPTRSYTSLRLVRDTYGLYTKGG